MREKYESLPLAELKGIAKARGLKGISTMRKPELIERMLEEDKKEATANEPVAQKPENTAAPVKAESTAAPERNETERKEASVRSRIIRNFEATITAEMIMQAVKAVITAREDREVMRNGSSRLPSQWKLSHQLRLKVKRPSSYTLPMKIRQKL